MTAINCPQIRQPIIRKGNVAAKLEIFISLKLSQILTVNLGFSTTASSKKVDFFQCAIAINPRFAAGISMQSVIVLKVYIFPVAADTASCQPLLQSPWDNFFKLAVVINPTFATGILTFIILSDI